MLGELVEILGPEALRRSIDAPSVAAGELLWQGRAGYCVTVVSGSRLGTDTIKTLKLQLGGTGIFQGSKTLPVRQILKIEVVANAMAPQLSESVLELIAVLGKNVTTG